MGRVVPSANVAKVWTFESESSSKTYETMQYTDGSTSCNCPGWTRRTDARGRRTCKHTRWVDQQLADRYCVSRAQYAATTAQPAQGARPEIMQTAKRKLALTEDV